MFVFPGKSRENAALVRWHSPIFAPTVAKTVAIAAPSADGQLAFYALGIAPIYKEVLQETIDVIGQRHGVPIRLKRLATEAGKEVAEALCHIAVMVAGEAAKRAIWE